MPAFPLLGKQGIDAEGLEHGFRLVDARGGCCRASAVQREQPHPVRGHGRLPRCQVASGDRVSSFCSQGKGDVEVAFIRNQRLRYPLHLCWIEPVL